MPTMREFSDKELDNLFKNTFSDYTDTPSDNAVNRIFDSIVDHQYEEDEDMVVPLWWNRNGAAVKKISIAVSSIAASLVVWFFVANSDGVSNSSQLADGSVMTDDNTVSVLSEETEIRNDDNTIPSADIDGLSYGNESNTSNIKESVVESISGSKINEIALGNNKAIDESNISSAHQSAFGVDELKEESVFTKQGVAFVNSQPEVNKIASGESISENGDAGRTPEYISNITIENQSNDADDNRSDILIDGTITDNIENNTSPEFIADAGVVGAKNADSLEIEKVLIVAVEEQKEEEPIVVFEGFEEDDKKDSKLKPYASLDAGFIAMGKAQPEIANSTSDAMATGALNLSLEYGNMSITVGAGMAELSASEVYEIAYSDVQINTNYRRTAFKGATAASMYTEEDRAYVEDKKTNEVAKSSNSYFILPVSAKYLWDLDFVKAGVKGSFVYYRLINDNASMPDFSAFNNLMGTANTTTIAENAVSVELSVPVYFSILENTQLFAELGAQGFTSQIVGSVGAANAPSFSFGTKAGVQFKL